MTTDRAAFVRAHTVVARPALLPEIALHLAHDSTALWRATEAWLRTHGVPPPFWAFAWAGGQALARHVLDHPEIVLDRRVVDFASGSGLVAIAAALAGARAVRAVDVDDFAIAAVALNAALNGVTIDARAIDLVDTTLADVDVVLAGDVFYDPQMSARVSPWLRRLADRGVDVLVGDPSRAYAPDGGAEILVRFDVPGVGEVEDRDVKPTNVLRLVARSGTSDTR